MLSSSALGVDGVAVTVATVTTVDAAADAAAAVLPVVSSAALETSVSVSSTLFVVID